MTLSSPWSDGPDSIRILWIMISQLSTPNHNFFHASNFERWNTGVRSRTLIDPDPMVTIPPDLLKTNDPHLKPSTDLLIQWLMELRRFPLWEFRLFVQTSQGILFNYLGVFPSDLKFYEVTPDLILPLNTSKFLTLLNLDSHYNSWNLRNPCTHTLRHSQ